MKIRVWLKLFAANKLDKPLHLKSGKMALLTTAKSHSKTHLNSFRERVLAVVASIPRGETRTYKEVAIQAGNHKAARAVGNIMSKNYDPMIPCHRVVRSDGTPGGYNRGSRQKALLLEQEQQVV